MKLRFKSKESWVTIALGIVTLAGVAAPIIFRHWSDARRTAESTLRWDLHTMRMAIDNCTLDKERPPQSWQDLVECQYLQEIPLDPITNKKDWALDFDEIVISPGQKARGIADVHSKSDRVGASGIPYNKW
jgi:general secretion pathway protein G